jgi:hypothetical protein
MDLVEDLITLYIICEKETLKADRLLISTYWRGLDWSTFAHPCVFGEVLFIPVISFSYFISETSRWIQTPFRIFFGGGSITIKMGGFYALIYPWGVDAAQTKFINRRYFSWP